MTKHTPTPWKLNENAIFRHDDKSPIANVLDPHNAKFILDAANNHQDLMNALKRCMYAAIDGMMSSPSLAPLIHQIAHQAILKAKGKES